MGGVSFSINTKNAVSMIFFSTPLYIHSSIHLYIPLFIPFKGYEWRIKPKFRGLTGVWFMLGGGYEFGSRKSAVSSLQPQESPVFPEVNNNVQSLSGVCMGPSR